MVTAKVESPNWLSLVTKEITLVEASKVMNVPVELSMLIVYVRAQDFLCVNSGIVMST